MPSPSHVVEPSTDVLCPGGHFWQAGLRVGMPATVSPLLKNPTGHFSARISAVGFAGSQGLGSSAEKIPNPAGILQSLMDAW
jgi:hypothetical protein